MKPMSVVRDEAVRNLSKALVGYKSLPIEPQKGAGESLHQVFAKYGVEITRKSYAEESSLIEALLQDLSAPDLEDSINALSGVAEAISAVRVAQNDFSSLRVAYEKAVAGQNSGATATQLKKILLEQINTRLLGYMFAMTMVDAARYDSFASKITKVIEDMNTHIKKRAKDKEIPKSPQA